MCIAENVCAKLFSTPGQVALLQEYVRIQEHARIQRGSLDKEKASDHVVQVLSHFGPVCVGYPGGDTGV